MLVADIFALDTAEVFFTCEKMVPFVNSIHWKTMMGKLTSSLGKRWAN